MFGIRLELVCNGGFVMLGASIIKERLMWFTFEKIPCIEVSLACVS